MILQRNNTVDRYDICVGTVIIEEMASNVSMDPSLFLGICWKALVIKNVRSYFKIICTFKIFY